MTHKKSFLRSLVKFSMDIRFFNWGLINFLFEIGIVIAGIIWACWYDPELIGPLFSWIAIGFVIFLVLLVVAVTIARAVVGWCQTKEQIERTHTEYYDNHENNATYKKEANKR